MERRFCSGCGMPVDECTCDDYENETTDFGAVRSQRENSGRSGSSYVKRFDKIALIQDEVVVRQYHIGSFAKNLIFVGKGDASIIITNKRIISKRDTNYLGSSSVCVEEMMLDSIAGVKNFFFQGFTKWRLIIGTIALVIGLIIAISSNVLIGLGFCAVALYMLITSRKPSYLFAVYAIAVNSAMEMGVNLRGKVFNANGNGIIFQYKPTKEAVKMMCEIGACIEDLKTQGDYAVNAWRKVR